MSNVPKLRFGEFEGEWVEKKLGDSATFFNSKRVALTESDRKSGNYPYYGASGIIDYVEDYIFNGEYILLGEDGANIVMRNSRLVFLAKGKFWLNNHAHIFQAMESNNFLCETLERINYSKYNTGTTQPKLNSLVVKKIKLYLPPKEEQEKISNFLISIDQKIEQLSNKRSLLESYKKGIIEKIFSKDIRFKRDDAGEFEDWEDVKLKDLTELITKGTTPTSVGFNFIKEGINFIKVESISKKFIIDIVNTPKISKECNLVLRRSILCENDIVFSIAGTLGRTAIIEKKDLPANTNQALSIIRLKKNQNIQFINYSLNIVLVKKYIKQMVSVGAQPNINLEQVGNIRIRLPQKEEQEKIAIFLSSIDQKITQNNKLLEQMKMFKKGLLQQMFV